MRKDDRAECAAGNAGLRDAGPVLGSPARDAPALDGAGWTRRHMTDPERARESIDLYESLGFDVATRALTPDDFGDRCRACGAEACHSYVLIYTRRKIAG